MAFNSKGLLIILAIACIEVNFAQTNQICDPDVPSRVPPKLNADVKTRLQGFYGTNCSEGQYLDFYRCLPCEEGTYRTKQMAALDRYSECQKCQEPGMHEYVNESCTKTRDAVIMCLGNFYRHEAEGKPCDSECRQCSVCGIGKNLYKNYEARHCDGYENTFCCEEENMVVVNGRCAVTTTFYPTRALAISSLPSIGSSAKSITSKALKYNETGQAKRQNVRSNAISKHRTCFPFVALLLLAITYDIL
ncbi:hypothetical protein Bpfe_030427 [Biomphalaria pfeifferi]|uniref:TNFR-Cys domain-containing protein n=1 Tax=Biomphalaria pfeifferi TaxID=112525 RepID=A0AAD8APV2_BIOPF|nr:hypothetical protein Bpfe_030427 [Biomphalaria pfeifferi]